MGNFAVNYRGFTYYRVAQGHHPIMWGGLRSVCSSRGIVNENFMRLLLSRRCNPWVWRKTKASALYYQTAHWKKRIAYNTYKNEHSFRGKAEEYVKKNKFHYLSRKASLRSHRWLAFNTLPDRDFRHYLLPFSQPMRALLHKWKTCYVKNWDKYHSMTNLSGLTPLRLIIPSSSA